MSNSLKQACLMCSQQESNLHHKLSTFVRLWRTTADKLQLVYLSSRQESNLHLLLRREISYPLNDGSELALYYTPNTMWSRIIQLPSRLNFRDPGSRFCVLAKHRCAKHTAQNLPQGRFCDSCAPGQNRTDIVSSARRCPIH